MAQIIPAILPTSREDLEEHLARLSTTEAEWVQIDAVDGRFAAPVSWPYGGGDAFPRELPQLARFKYEIDLMVADPVRAAREWLRAGASRLAIHAESALDLGAALGEIKKMSGHGFAPEVVSLGLALSLETPEALIEPYIAQVDYVQLMGIAHIGKQHQPFDARVLQKIRTLRAAHPELVIQVDGGVSRMTLPQLVAAGATRFIVGSALWSAVE